MSTLRPDKINYYLDIAQTVAKRGTCIRRKFGAIICDDVEIGCGSVINPGSVICNSSRVYPLTSVRGVIEENQIVKSSGQIVSIK